MKLEGHIDQEYALIASAFLENFEQEDATLTRLFSHDSRFE